MNVNPNTTLEERAAFFYEHAGYSYDPETETPEEGRALCARKLAEAEQEAQRRGWHVATSEDPNVMEDDAGSVELVASGEMVNLDVWLMAGPDADPECISDVLGVIGGVVVPFADDPYVRVMGAELAREALAEQPNEQGERSWGTRLLSEQTANDRLRELIGELAGNRASVDPDTEDFLVDQAWASDLEDLVLHSGAFPANDPR